MNKLLWFTATLVSLYILISMSEARAKKVVLHLPMSVKSMKHTHTVIKTMHKHHFIPKAKKRDQELEQEDEEADGQTRDYGGGEQHYWTTDPKEDMHVYRDYYE